MTPKQDKIANIALIITIVIGVLSVIISEFI